MEKVFSFSLRAYFNLGKAWHMEMAVPTTKTSEVFHPSIF